MKHFGVVKDMSLQGRVFYHLAKAPDGTLLEETNFLRGRRFPGALPLRLTVRVPGPSTHIEFAGIIPLLHRELATKIQQVAADDIELIPASVDGESPDACFVMNILSTADAIDPARTRRARRVVESTLAADSPYAAYSHELSIRLKPDAFNGDILRVKNGGSLIVVSSRIRGLLDVTQPPGVVYSEV